MALQCPSVTSLSVMFGAPKSKPVAPTKQRTPAQQAKIDRRRAARKEQRAFKAEREVASNCECPCCCMDEPDNYDCNGDLFHTDDCDFCCMCQDGYNPEPPADWYPSAEPVEPVHEDGYTGPDCDDISQFDESGYSLHATGENHVEVPHQQHDLVEFEQIQAECNAAQRAARTLQLAVPHLSDDHLEQARTTIVADRAVERRQNGNPDAVLVSVRDQVDETIRAEQQERNYHKHLAYYDTKPARAIPF